MLRDEVIGEWRKLHNEELNDLYVCIMLVNCWTKKTRQILELSA